jgi:hypothetical protein
MKTAKNCYINIDPLILNCLIPGNYSVTGFEMILTRRMSHYMITYYLPRCPFHESPFRQKCFWTMYV